MTAVGEVPAAADPGAASRVARPEWPVSRPPSRLASWRVLIRLPLWPRARLADGVARNVGCAFSQTEEPVVEYRQCPTAM
jgi:hypothetical protein